MHKTQARQYVAHHIMDMHGNQRRKLTNGCVKLTVHLRTVLPCSSSRTHAAGIATVRYSLFNFGVNKFISGVKMYNLGVKVQPRCEPSNTC